MTLLNFFNSYYSFFWDNSSLFLKFIGIILVIIILIIVLRLFILIDRLGTNIKVAEVKLVNKKDLQKKPESVLEGIKEIFSGEWYYSFQIEGKEYLLPMSKEMYLQIPLMKKIEIKYVKGRFSSKVYFKAI
jgi:hypothetical protein